MFCVAGCATAGETIGTELKLAIALPAPAPASARTSRASVFTPSAPGWPLSPSRGGSGYSASFCCAAHSGPCRTSSTLEGGSCARKAGACAIVAPNMVCAKCGSASMGKREESTRARESARGGERERQSMRSRARQKERARAHARTGGGGSRRHNSSRGEDSKNLVVSC